MRLSTAWMAAVVCLSPALAIAQTITGQQLKTLQPRSIGPAGMSGRITAVDVVVNQPNTWYLGAASGGVWKTENAGTTWQSIFDDQPNINIGAVAVNQQIPSILWVGTGEGNPRNSINIGEGIYRSLDAGKTWQRMGLEKTRNIHRILLHPNNPEVVYAGAIGNPYTEHADRGLFKTTDGGASWQKILYTNDTSGVGDMIMDPSNPNKLLVAMWQHRRTQYDFKSGGPGSGLYLTLDGGKSFKKLGKDNGLPEGNYGRIGLTISQSNPNVIYALVEATKNGLYRSNDGGEKWELVNSNPEWVTNRPFYFQDIRVDPVNENRVYLVYQMIAMSEDGGKNFKVIVPYNGIHPDHHAFWIHPKDPNFIIDGNDGGIGISRDRGMSWKFDEQLPVGQFYHINVDNAIPYRVMGGMQDNGSWRGPAYTWTEGGIRNYHWNSLWGGDGFDVVPDPENPDLVYAMSQGGNVGIYNVKTGESQFIKPSAPDTKTRLRFNWNAAIAIDPLNPKTVYFGSQFLHKSNNKGLVWETISPDLTTNDLEKLKATDNTGGLSLDITGAETHSTILSIAPSFKEQGVIWVSTDDGNVQLTKDGGKSWTNFRGKIPGLPAGCWIPQIRASQYNAAEAWFVANDYRRGDFKPYAYYTSDFGKTWKRIADEKAVTGYALTVLQDPAEPNLVFLGTEQGLYVSYNKGNSWQQFKNGYPSVSTYDLAIQEREADLAIATFGRALWILDDIRPLRAIAANQGKTFTEKVKVFTPPTAYQVETRNVEGYEWSTWGMYEGQNRSRGAMISFWANPSKSKDSAWVKVYDAANTEVRAFKVKADSGLNRFNWRYETKGMRTAGQPKPKPGANETVGMLPAYPGTYKVVIAMGDIKDSTQLMVVADPAVMPNRQLWEARKQYLQSLQPLHDQVNASLDQITDAEEVLKKLDTQLKDQSGKSADTLRKASAEMTKQLKTLKEAFNGKSLDKQGYGRPYQVTPIGKLREASFAVLGKNMMPGEEAANLKAQAAELVSAATSQTSQFFQKQWSEFKSLVKANPLSLFKD